MQLATVATISSVHAPLAPVAAPSTGLAQPPTRTFGTRAPAPTNAPAPLESAIDGVARLAPIIDFPGIVAGDVFDIVKGSKAGPIGVRGEATIERFDADHATIHVKAGRFGFKVDVTVDIVQLDDERVRISSRGTGIPDMSEIGRIVESRTDYAVFEQESDPSKQTIIAHDGEGHVTIDTVIPTLGDAHLELERRSS